MELPEVLNMLNDLRRTAEDWGMYPKLRVSGGEPLLRKNLFEILAHSKDKGIPTGLLTNGNLIDKEIATKLKDHGVSQIQVSLDGKRKRHNRIRQSLVAYDLALRGMTNARKAGMKVTASMTAMNSNKKDLEDVILSAISAGATAVGFQSYVPDKKLGFSDPEYLGRQKTLKVFRDWEILSKKYNGQINILKNEVLWQILQQDNNIKIDARNQMKYLGGCSAGYFSLSVLSDGTVYPCRRLPISVGNISEGIKNIITESRVMKELRNLKKIKENSLCDKVAHCRGCRAIAYAVYGNYMAKDPMCFKELI